jgi:farnesyl-diphosphate farnesyltransferase
VGSLSGAEREFCDRALGNVSRTFALSIRGLPRPLEDAVRAAYLLCRIVDTIEDDRRLPPPTRARLFAAFDDALASAASERSEPAVIFQDLARRAWLGTGDEGTLCAEAAIVFRAFSFLSGAEREAIAPRILEMSSGMNEYSRRADERGGLRLLDLEDLERYCHYVAGTVGELLTELFSLGCRLPAGAGERLDARASRFGIGLQLVNILKDVAEDAERGDCFLPIAVAADHGADLEHLLDPSQRRPALEMCRSLSQRAREHLVAAEEYTLAWPLTGSGRDARLFCAGPLALALATLRQIELGTDALRAGRAPTVSREFVAGLFGDLARAMSHGEDAESDRALRLVFDRARVGVAGRSSRPPAPESASRTSHRGQWSSHP